MIQSPRNTSLGPLADQTYLLQVTQVKSVTLYVSQAMPLKPHSETDRAIVRRQ